MKKIPLRFACGLAGAWFACLLPCGAAIQVAGSLLIDLDAGDFAFGSRKWHQHTAGTGIPGDFVPKGSPTREVVAGANAVVFDGDGDYFVGPFTTAALHAPGAKHSVEVWVYQGNIREQESVVSWGKRWGRPDLSLAGFRYGTDPELGAIGRWGSYESGFEKVPTAGQWHQLTYTYDGKTQTVYVDGEADNSKPVGLLDAHDMLPIHLGAEIRGDLTIEGPFTQFSGALGRVRIHSGCLGAEQVRLNYVTEKTAFPGLSASALKQAPVHRFSFNAETGAAPDGTLIPDRIGGLIAVVRGARAKFEGGGLQLPGGSSMTEAYVDFPNGLISAHENVTIEFWATQTAAQVWSRILSIGTNQSGEIPGPGGHFVGSETLTLFGNVGSLQINRFARSFGSLSNGGPDRDPAAYPDSDYGQEFHQVITYDKHLAEWHWYRNGLLMEVIPDREGPSSIEDVNVWLGRSEFSADNNFRGLIREFRIYNHALSQSEILGNHLAGPQKLDLARPTPALMWRPVQPGEHLFANGEGQDQWGSGLGGSYPDGSGSTATFSSAIQGDQRIQLSVPITLGALNLGSPLAKGSIKFEADKTGAIAMDSGDGGPAIITQAPDCPPNKVIAPITIVSDTEMINQSTELLTVGGSIHGRGAIVKAGSGPVLLEGDGGTYNGTIHVLAGDLVLGGGQEVRLPMVSLTRISAPGRLVFDRPDHAIIDGEFTGSGSIIQRGTGILTLSESGFITHTGRILQENGSGILENQGLIDGPTEIRSDASVVLGGRSVTRLAEWMSIGTEDGGTLTIRDSANFDIQGPGHLNIGDLGTGQSVMRMEGGSLSYKEFFIGKYPGASGVVIQSGGSITKDGQLDTRIGGGVADSHDNWGAWIMKGGSLTDSWNLQIGGYGTGIMEVDGGNVRVTGFLSIARYADGNKNRSHGMLDLKSGTITSTQSNNYVLVGEEGTGILNLRGGSFNCANRLMIGAGTIDHPGEGTVNLMPGGILVTSGIAQMNESEAVGRLYLNGGLLKAGASSGAFLEGLDQVHVGPDGANIDTNGFNIVVLQDLSTPPGEGIVRIPVIDGGKSFLAPPFLRIEGGGGQGASAIAELDDGSVRSITVSNPGGAYKSPPDVTIIGGGSGTGLKLGAPELARHAGGGLNKSGAGKLTLAGANTYPGATRVSRGALELTGSVKGSVELSSGAILSGNGVIGGGLTAGPGSIIEPAPGAALTVQGEAEIQGTDFSIDADPNGNGFCRLDVTGRLNLNDAKLMVKPGCIGKSDGSGVIASYGSLNGRFILDAPLPTGWSIDYNYKGLKQIALVATEADAE